MGEISLIISKEKVGQNSGITLWLRKVTFKYMKYNLVANQSLSNPEKWFFSIHFYFSYNHYHRCVQEPSTKKNPEYAFST